MKASSDLHAGFRDPQRVPGEALAGFLEHTDRLPGIRAIQAALRRALAIEPGMRLLDAGCGPGFETARLASNHPDVAVTGLDRNRELLAAARRRGAADNLSWVHADLTKLERLEPAFDAIRTERVLMYMTDADFEPALDTLVRLLRPGGRLAVFELDYGATILAPGAAGDPVVRRATDALADSLPQPWAGRRIPGLLAAREMDAVAASPWSFAVSEPVWRRIVHDTLTAGEPPDRELARWLQEQGEAAARGEFVAAFAGVLTTAQRRPA